MMAKRTAYPHSGGDVVEDTAFGFTIAVHYPDNRAALEKRVAQAHADAVISYIQYLNCSRKQKIALLDAVIVS